jgi:lipopolysaccharide export system permease protein
MIGATLPRYIAGRTLRGILLAFLIVTAIIALVDYVEASRNIGADADLSPLELLILTGLKIPKLIEQTIPFVVLFGVMGALSGMNRRSELTVMRAAGLSAWRFLRPALIVTALIGVLWSTVINPLSSRMMGEYDARTAAIANSAQSDGIWLREGSDSAQRVIQAQGLDLASKTLNGAIFYEMGITSDGATVFERRFDAQTARLLTPGYWTLDNVIENAPGEVTQRTAELTLPTDISIEDLREQSGQQVDPPFWEIRQAIQENEAAGFSARELRLQFHKLLALPFLLIAMTFIAAGVSMHLVRSGGTLRLLIMGAVLGFAVFFADSVITAFGEVAILPVTLAAWTIPILVLLLGITHLAKIEDG